MLGEELGVALDVLVQEPGRALDIGKEEGDGAGREFAHLRTVGGLDDRLIEGQASPACVRRVERGDPEPVPSGGERLLTPGLLVRHERAPLAPDLEKRRVRGSEESRRARGIACTEDGRSRPISERTAVSRCGNPCAAARQAANA